MTLHIFNPEHDIALAFGADNFTPPHAARQLHNDLCWIPAIWADEGDAVLVSDNDFDLYNRLLLRAIRPNYKNIKWVTDKELSTLFIDKVAPWGWDSSIVAFLQRKGVSPTLLPDKDSLTKIRQLSSRHNAAKVLSSLRHNLPEDTCGDARIATSLEDVILLSTVFGDCVIKSPWSSSGRGVRFSSGNLETSLLPWIRRTIDMQGSIMVERKENKIADFALEYASNGKGNVTYSGLSLFSTRGTAYTGNIILPEEEKRKLLEKWIDNELLDTIQESVRKELESITTGIYAGPLGVDMMIVSHPKGNGYIIHPCVEINVRHTMGMLANALTLPSDSLHPRIMQINYDGSYHLNIISKKIEDL